jgi:hypothetical protein
MLKYVCTRQAKTSLRTSPTERDRLSTGAIRGGVFASPAYIYFNTLYPPEFQLRAIDVCLP